MSSPSHDGHPSHPDPSSSQPTSRRPHSHPQAQRPPVPPPQPPRQVNYLPQLKLTIPRQGRQSSATSERCFTYCSQTHRGRAEGLEPTCRTFCLRRVFAHEVNRTLVDAGYSLYPFFPPASAASVPVEVPLPPEADTSIAEYYSGRPAGVESPADDSGKRGRGHWKEGYYLWMSQTRLGAVEHMAHMKRDLQSQSAYERHKALWARAVREGREVDFVPAVNGHLVSSAWQDDMHQDILLPSHTSLLLPLSDPAPQLRNLIGKYLAPTERLLVLARDSVTSGDQSALALRMQGAVMNGAPFALAGSIGKKMWKLLWGEGEGEERE